MPTWVSSLQKLFRSKKKGKGNGGSSSSTLHTITSSTARAPTSDNYLPSPRHSRQLETPAVKSKESSHGIIEHLELTEPWPENDNQPEERVVRPSIAIPASPFQDSESYLSANTAVSSCPPLAQASVTTRNESTQLGFYDEVASSASHTPSDPGWSHIPPRCPIGLPPPAVAAPQVVSSIMNNRINTGGDSIIYNVAGNLEVNKDTTTRLQKLKIILNPVQAAWDSYEADQRSKCFENTRLQLLSDIKAWINGADSHAPIFILDGVAGIGKSTIAQTIAELAAGHGILGASFFFTRNEQERATAKHFFPTIAFQLARYNTAFAQKIAEALESDPDAAQKTIYQQLSLLVFAPLKDLVALKEPPILIVIDALDECKEEEAESLLILLAQHIPHMPQLRLFITTRPESHVRDVLARDRNHELFRLHEIEDYIVQSDIRLYLNSSLSAESVLTVFPHLRPPWCPSKHDMNMLCGVCGTLFIIASTATKFVLDKKAQNPARRLARLLDGVSPADFSGSKHTNVMDKFYIQIIRAAVPDLPDEAEEWFQLYQVVVGAIITLQYPLPAQALATLLSIEVSQIEATLYHLHSLVAPSGPELIYRVHHKSLPDFITSAERIKLALDSLVANASELASKFLIDTKRYHQEIARACFRVMDRNLKQNVADLSPDQRFQDLEDIASLRDKPFGDDLTYAASHWASHIRAAGELNCELQIDLEKWVFTHIMSWLEVMIILGQMKPAYEMLGMALDAIDANPQAWIENDRDGVHRMLSDTRRFLLQSGEVLKLTPMHIHQSALSFLPRNTSLNRTFGDAKGLKVLSGIEEEWDPAALVTITGHSSPVKAVSFSPNGTTLASASRDNTVSLWDSQTGARISTFAGHSDDVNDVSFSPDGSRLASASTDHTIRLWDVTTGAHLVTLEGHSDRVNTVRFSPDGSRLASGSNDNTIRLWDGTAGAHLTTLRVNSRRVGGVNSVAFSPNGWRLVGALAASKHTVCLWDGTTDVYLVIPEGHFGWVEAVTFSPDGSRLASASRDHNIRLWEATTDTHIITLEGHTDWVTDIAFSPDGARLASASLDKTVRLWDATKGAFIIIFNGHSNAVLSVAFSSDGSRLASGSLDSTICLWNVRADNLEGHSSNASLTPGTVNTPFTPLNYIHRHAGGITAMAHSPDGSKFVSGSTDGTLRLWDGKTGTHIITLRGYSRPVSSIAFSPDGSRLASACYNYTILLLDGKTGNHIRTLFGHSRGITDIAFSPDGSKLASGSDDTTIRLWDGTTGDRIKILNGHSKYVHALAFSPDCLWLVSASSDKTFRVWAVSSGSHISTINSVRIMRALAFSPGGSTIASIDADHACASLYLQTANEPVRPVSLEKHFKFIISFAFLPKALHSTSLPINAIRNGAILNPLFTHPVTSDYPLHIIALGRRQNPSLCGLVYLAVPASGEPVMDPLCWFPPHFKVKKFSVDPTGSYIAVGCESGRVLLLDISFLEQLSSEFGRHS